MGPQEPSATARGSQWGTVQPPAAPLGPPVFCSSPTPNVASVQLQGCFPAHWPFPRAAPGVLREPEAWAQDAGEGSYWGPVHLAPHPAPTQVGSTTGRPGETASTQVHGRGCG